MNKYIKVGRHYAKRIDPDSIWMAARSAGGNYNPIRLRVSIPAKKLLTAFGTIPETVNLYNSANNNHQFFIIDSKKDGYSLMHTSTDKYTFWVTIEKSLEYFKYIDHGESYDHEFEKGKLWFKIKEIRKNG